MRRLPRLPQVPGGYDDGADRPILGSRWLIPIVVLVLLLVLFFAFTSRVEAGEACAVTRFGKVNREAGPGLHVRIPGVESFRCFRTAATFYEVLTEEGSVDADFIDGVLDGVTRDGQPVNITFSVRYHIPEANVGEVYQSIGKTMPQVNERVVKFFTRSIVRQLVQTYTAEQLYSGDLAAISQTMNQALTPLFADSSVVLEYFELKRPRFQENYEQAIEAKQIALEQIETSANEARVAEQQAIGQANLAQGDANAQRIRAEGEAQAIALRGQATRANPEIVSLNYIEALKTINWAILDGESVQPFLTLDTPGAAATPAP